MYESHFELQERPFAAAPLVQSYVPSANIEHARLTLARCVERAEGIGLVIGSAGTGKSLLCQLLAEHFRQRQFQVALLASARLDSRRSLLQNVLFELGLPYRGMDDEELRLSLIDHLAARGNSPGGLVLIIDEAHTLPLRLLEELRLISNIVQGGQLRVRLVLAGGPPMEERLANPKLESLSQRIAARCYLAPLNREETGNYVRTQLARVGGVAGRIAPESVLQAIHQASDGIPRLINQVCDHALILAALDGQKMLTPRRIEQAWADLQQLPAPWLESAKTPLAEAASSAIEFGQLDETPAPSSRVEIPTGDPLGSQTLADLDQIDRSLESLRRDADTTSNVDESAADPFEDLPAESPHDLFGSGFDDEEVVIDRYASLEARTFPPRSRVASAEGHEIAQALAAADQETSPTDDATPVANPTGCSIVRLIEEADELESELVDGARETDYRPEDDPVLPESTEPSQPRPSLTLRPLTDDDRDMIIVQTDFSPQQEATLLTQRRRKYRQLISTLRQG